MAEKRKSAEFLVTFVFRIKTMGRGPCRHEFKRKVFVAARTTQKQADDALASRIKNIAVDLGKQVMETVPELEEVEFLDYDITD